MYRILTLFLLTAALMLSAGCSNNTTGIEPEPDEQEATTGKLEITATTTGSSTDPDGYTVTVGSSTTKSMDINSSVIFGDLEEGPYSVELSDLAEGCSVDGDNPQTATITADVTTTIGFSVVCEAAAPSVDGVIAFTKVVDQNFEIFTMNPDGSSQQRLTNNSFQDSDAIISPDGTKIAYMSQDPQNTNFAVWVMDIDGSNKTQLTAEDTNNRFPTWSPDGTKIAFESDRDGNFNIYVMDADGTNEIQLTSDTNQDQRPSWSPQGDKIMFTSNRDGDSSTDIFTINADGTGLAKLMDASDSNGINLFDPVWSPDGTQIAYQGFASNGGPRIFVAGADGSNARMLTPEGYNSAYHPAWSPDGSYLALTELASGSSGSAIWVVRADGTGSYRLTDPEVASSTHPSWGIAANQ